MKAPKRPMHEHCPAEYRQTPNMTGDYEMDASIMASKNSDVPRRLKMYLSGGNAYSPVTNYGGYHNYHGDD